MLLKPLIVHPFDIRYRTDAAVVFVVGVTAAVVLIGINDGQNLDKMLPRVVLIINQFVIEAQDLGTQKIGIALIINLDMLLQLLLGLLLLFQHFSIQGVSDDFRKPAPRIDLDGRNLNEREQHQNHPATAPEQFFQIHSHPPH